MISISPCVLEYYRNGKFKQVDADADKVDHSPGDHVPAIRVQDIEGGCCPGLLLFDIILFNESIEIGAGVFLDFVLDGAES